SVVTREREAIQIERVDRTGKVEPDPGRTRHPRRVIRWLTRRQRRDVDRTALDQASHGGEQEVDTHRRIRTHAGTVHGRRATERDVDRGDELVDRDDTVAAAVTGAARRRWSRRNQQQAQGCEYDGAGERAIIRHRSPSFALTKPVRFIESRTL